MQLKMTLKKLNLQNYLQRVINIYFENYERFKWERPSCISYELILKKKTKITETL